MKLLRWLARAVITMFTAAAAWIILAWLMFPAFGLMWNISDSLPFGIYREINAPLRRGNIVMFCLSGEAAALTQARGYVPQRWLKTGCEHNLVALMKPIAALPGDRIEQTTTGISINGVPQPNTVHLAKDGAGLAMPMPPLPAVVPANHLLLLSSYNPFSWDSRYYGLIPMNNVRAVVRPLITFTYHAEEK